MFRLDARQLNAGVTGQVFLPQTVSHLPRVYSVYIIGHCTGILAIDSCHICSSEYCRCPGHLAILQISSPPQGLDVCRETHDATGVN